MKQVKNQGQSTTEYLLLIVVATFFAVSFASYLNPKFSSWIEALEDRVAEKIAGGELLSHPKKIDAIQLSSSEEGAGKGADGSENAGNQSQKSLSPSISMTEADNGERSEEDSSSGNKGGAAGAKTPISKEIPVIAEESSSKRTENMPVLESETKKEEGGQDKKEEKEDASKTKGMLYKEGQESEALGITKFNWVRVLIIVLIVMVVSYILFEIYKVIQLNRFKK